MPSENLTSQVQRFLAEHISSVAQLDLLLLLRTNPQQYWSAADLVRELRVDTAWAESQLREMAARRVLAADPERPDCFRYAPADAELDAAIAATARGYLLNRVSVIEFIYRPNQTLRAFAEAFRFRREPPDG